MFRRATTVTVLAASSVFGMTVFCLGAEDAAKSAPSEPSSLVLQQVRILKGFDIPECVCIDPATGFGYVSNIVAPSGDKSKVNAVDGTGFISRLAPGGTIDRLHWVDSTPQTPLNSIKGMCAFGGVLYAADLNRVVRYELATGKTLEPIAIHEAKMLNDMATDDRYVYVSDTATGKVFRLDGSRVDVISTLEGANGITFAKGKMYAVSVTRHDVYEMDPCGKKAPQPFGLADHFTGLDGIEVLADGSFLISDVAGQQLVHVDANRKTVHVLCKLAWPADIGFDRNRNLLMAPLFWDSQVMVFRLIQSSPRATSAGQNP